MKITMLSDKTGRYSKAHKGPWVDLARCKLDTRDDAKSDCSIVLCQKDDGTRVEINVGEFEVIKQAFAACGLF